MQRRVVLVFAFILLLIPSAQFAWRNRDMPEFGHAHDDAILFSSAKSLAQGDGYRIASLPETPYQTKYPPLYPLYLSLAWKLNPNFPDNLGLASLLSWPLVAVFLILGWVIFRQNGFSQERALLLTGIMGLNPYMALFGASLLSEVFFTCFLLLTLILARRKGYASILLAALAASCAYLSRTAGIGLLISVPALLLWKRDWRRASLFAAAMLPVILGWTMWSHAHGFATTDPGMIYYTDYVRFEFINVGWDNFAVVLWKNIDQILYGIGSLVLPKVFDSLAVKILAQVIAVAMISGVVRLVRRGILADYAIFGVISAGMLVVWHYPPNERFVLPLFPLLIAGLLTEVEHIAAMIRQGSRNQDRSQRIAAAGMGGAMWGLLAAALVLQIYVAFWMLPLSAQETRAKRTETRTAYAWVEGHLPLSATVLSNDDPLLYLYTGHRGNAIPLMPRWWYADDHASIVDAYSNVAQYCRRRGLNYVYSTSEDLTRWAGNQDIEQVLRVLKKNPYLVPVFSGPSGTVYKVSP